MHIGQMYDGGLCELLELGNCVMINRHLLEHVGVGMLQEC
jgi:hypothetical protein